jgi:hypothetical protein
MRSFPDLFNNDLKSFDSCRSPRRLFDLSSLPISETARSKTLAGCSERLVVWIYSNSHSVITFASSELVTTIIFDIYDLSTVP